MTNEDAGDEDLICPECGMKNPEQNSSGNVECDNCGYDEEGEEE